VTLTLNLAPHPVPIRARIRHNPQSGSEGRLTEGVRWIKYRPIHRLFRQDIYFLIELVDQRTIRFRREKIMDNQESIVVESLDLMRAESTFHRY
jgi:hypothetical protein